MPTLIEKQASAAVSAPINVTTGPVIQTIFNRVSRGGHYPIGTTIRITGGVLQNDEHILLEYRADQDWLLGNVGGNGGKVLDADNSMFTIHGRMTDIRFRKTATASALGLETV